MNNVNESVKEKPGIMQKIRHLHPRYWSIRYKLQVVISVSTFLVLGILIILVFVTQKGANIRQASINMSLCLDTKASHLEDYFKSINNHLATFASNSNTIGALDAFSNAFAGIEADHYFTSSVGSIDEMNGLLKGFYSAEIFPVLEDKMDEPLQIEQFLSGDRKQEILQYLYLADNARSLSQKYIMNRASDGSLYSDYHSRYHPQMITYARQIGLSDILLVDYKTGYVVYSLKKNIDFATNLYEGPFKNSALANAYMDAVGVSTPGIIKYNDESFYYPAMMQPTVFVSAPVFSGDRILGAVVFALDVSTFDRLMAFAAAEDKQAGPVLKTFLIGNDLAYRTNDPDFINDPEAYITNLKKNGINTGDYLDIGRLQTTALIQKVDYQSFIKAYDQAQGQVFYKAATGEKAYSSYRLLENNELNWMICAQVSNNNLFAPAYMVFRLMCLASAVLLVFIYLAGRYFNISIYKPIYRLRTALSNLKDGVEIKEIDSRQENELGQTAEAYNMLSQRINKIITFIAELGKDNFEVEMNETGANDQIGSALNMLKNNLMHKKSEEENRKNEDEIRNWNTHGIALFNDILRLDNDNLEKLSLNIVRNLIQYLKANQGGLFLLEGEEGEQKLNLIASIAFDRQKFIKKTIEIGEGLTGTCVLEKQTILLNKIPDDYIEITSGLGGARPGSLVIVPMKKDEVVYGVIELASFSQFQQHEVEFIEKVADHITDTIVNVRLNLQNVQLLERFQQQAEEMKAQDEELRQNIEELKATHEQMERMKQEEKEKTEKFLKEIEDNRKLLIDVLDNIPGKIFVKDENGVLLLLNSEVARVYNKKVDELIGTSDFDNHPHDLAKEYRAKELEIMEKGAETYIQEETLTGEMRYLKTTKMPFKIATTGKTGLMGIQIDVTDFVRIEKQNKEKEEELRQNIEELKTTQEQMDQLKQKEIERKEQILKELGDNRKLLIDVLDKIPGKIFVKDENGVLLLLNSEVARVYNKKVDELIGTSDFDNHPHDLAKEYRAKELEIMEKGAETYIQEETLTGEMRYLKTTKMPFKIATTGKTGLMGFQIDVTENRLMEDQVNQLKTELDKVRDKLKGRK